MQAELDTVSFVAAWMRVFYEQNPILSMFIVATITGWVTTLTLKQFLSPGWKHRRKAIWLFDVLISGYVATRLWPYGHKDIVFLFAGGLSPVLYFITTWVLIWKWPKLKPFLSIKTEHKCPSIKTEAKK